ncbi:MAG: permease [Chlamydiota bacterium]|nr:permease [Chlamydiota bacterium]
MLQLTVERLIFQVLGLSLESRIGGALNFFIYDSIKILFLLFIMISVIGFLRSFLPHNRIKTWLGNRGPLGYLLASSFGALSPFCSCSSIPIFLSLIKIGVPLGITFSFLVTSPLINEYLVVLMFGFFGWKITLFYIFSGITIGVISGMVLGKMNLEGYCEKDIITDNNDGMGLEEFRHVKDRLFFGIREAVSIVQKLWLWILAGVAVGAFIHNYIPQESIQHIVNKTGFFSVPLATLLGIPMYGSCAAIVPIAVVLFQKGVPLGTALAFMMAVSALSLPEAIMLRRAMKLQLISIFFGVTAIAIMLTGYLFNLLQQMLI